MVRNYVRKTTRGSWSIVKMGEAVDAVLSKRMGYKKASELYGVPKSTLAGRVIAMRKLQILNPSQTFIKSERSGTEEEQHEETVEAYTSYQPQPKIRKIQSAAIQNEEQDNTGHSFSSHSVNEPLDQTCSFITLSEDMESPSNSTYSLNPTALYWSHKLDNMDITQRLFAEKYINDILLEAQLGNLGRNSVIIKSCNDSEKSSRSAVNSDCIPTTSSNN